MTLSDFTKQPRGPYAFDIWLSNQAIPSPMGEFLFELQMFSGGGVPNREMLRQAEELVALFRADSAILYDKVYEHYQEATDSAGWFGDSGVPAGLDRMEMLAYLEERSLVVSRDDPYEPFYCRVHIIPAWDEEHAIYLAHEDGEWEFVES